MQNRLELAQVVRSALPVLEAAAPRIGNRRYRRHLNRLYLALGEVPPYPERRPRPAGSMAAQPQADWEGKAKQ